MPLVEAALKAGKHVLSQKPFVVDLDTGERLVELADKNGVKLAVNQNGRWAPHFAYMREAVRAGLIGDVVSSHTAVHWDHSWIVGTPFEKIDDLIFFDFAVHWFDFLSSLIGARGTSVYATRNRAAGQQAKPPLLAQALVAFDGGQASLVFDAAIKHGPLDQTFVGGTKGSLASTGPNLGEQSVTLTTAEGVARPQLEGAWFNDGFAGTMGELLVAIEEKREPLNGARGNLDSLALVFAAIASAHSGQPVIARHGTQGAGRLSRSDLQEGEVAGNGASPCRSAALTSMPPAAGLMLATLPSPFHGTEPMTCRTSTVPPGSSVRPVGTPAASSGCGVRPAESPSIVRFDALLDAEAVHMTAAPRRIVASAVREPQHGHRQPRRVAQADEQITLLAARHRRPPEPAAFGLDACGEILVPRGEGVSGDVGLAAACQREMRGSTTLVGHFNRLRPRAGSGSSGIWGVSHQRFGEKLNRPPLGSETIAWLATAMPSACPPVKMWRW